ncbi:MAG: protein tyrosine phosphatase [Selenomonas sp.]|nr:protein tyrosine phosphatase [Selenomonas sp.]
MKIPHSAGTEKEEPDYSGYIWRIDAENRESLPRNFRTADGPFRQDMPEDKAGKGFTRTPSRQGLDCLAMSGSAEFSMGEFKVLQQVLKTKTKGPVYVVDLRQESHGLFNGQAVSWYGVRDWGNRGKTRREALQDERQRLKQAEGKRVLLAKLNKKKQPADPHWEKIDNVMREQQLVEGAGWHYWRLTDTDHVWPAAENIEAFVDFVRKLPQDAWLHFHCQAGKGRTTTYMALYDMMKNPDVPLGDVLSRQYLLGGAYLAYDPSKTTPGKWKSAYYHQKAGMIEKFYRYVQAAHQDGFTLKWSKWLQEHEDV